MLSRHRSLRMRLMALWLAVLMTAGAVPCAAQQAAPAEGKKYLSIDYHEFPTLGAAIKNSLAPTDFRANTGAVLRNTVDPLNPARYIAAVALVEVQRQLASGQGLNVGAILDKMSPAGLTMGYFGGQAGELLGAAAQSILANTLGTVGGVAGFAMRPVLWYIGSTMGQEIGRDLSHGKFDPSKAAAHTLREFNPVNDASQMIGDAIGSVIGQALIPIPLVGAMVGGGIGGTLGLLVGKAFSKTQAGESVDGAFRRRLDSLARSLNPTTAGPAAPAPGPAAPAGSTLVPAAASIPQPLSAEGRAAYQKLMDTMQSGDKPAIEKAYAEFRKAGGR